MLKKGEALTNSLTAIFTFPSPEVMVGRKRLIALKCYKVSFIVADDLHLLS